MEAVLKRSVLTAGELQHPEIFRNVAQVRDRRHLSLLQRLHHDGVLYTGAERVSGISLHVGNGYLVYQRTERVLERGDLRVGGTSPRRSVCLMRHEDRFLCIFGPVQVMKCVNLIKEEFHILGKMRYIYLTRVEC